MKDTLTESVARLYRAGSEHSQQTKKLRVAVDTLLMWLKQNLPDGFVLPCNCKLYPSGEFVCTYDGDFSGDQKLLFKITIGHEHTLSQLSNFTGLIAEGFLDKISKGLEDKSVRFKTSVQKIEMMLQDELKTFVLIQFSQGAGLVWIYGTIYAVDANAAAASISSEIVSSGMNGALGMRHRLKEADYGREWFLEEIKPISSRPDKM